MKTSEEMARSVMERAQAHRAATRKKVFTAAAATLCACVLIISAVTFKTPNKGSGANPLPVSKVNIRPAKIGLVNYAAASQTPVELEQGVMTPYAMEIRVHDIRGKTEEEVNTLYQADMEYAKELVQTTVGPTATHQWGIFHSQNTIVSTICAGHFFIEIEDYKQVEDVRMTLVGTGALAHVNQVDSDAVYQNSQSKEYIKDYWRVAIESYQTGGVSFIWHLSSETQQKLANDPTIPLSSFSDTITVTVNMKDGSKQMGIIDIQVADDGTVSATYRDDTKTE